jgi:hypothetical protein
VNPTKTRVGKNYQVLRNPFLRVTQTEGRLAQERQSMFLDLLEDWIKDSAEKKTDEFGLSELLVLRHFALWLDSRRPSPRPADLPATQAACEHTMVASTNIGELCKCSKCGTVTPLS